MCLGPRAFYDLIRETKPAPKGAPANQVSLVRFPWRNGARRAGQELAFSTVTARRFCDQQEMSLQTATGRSLP